MITQKELKELFHYDPDTGVFTRLKPAGKTKAGDSVGSDCGHGYIETRINRKKYYMHRLAWLFHYGEMPTGQIDHINGDRSDNRICNLRDVSSKENGKNKGKLNSNSSGFTGVSWHKGAGKWVAQIKINGKSVHLGLFETLIDAVIVRIKANQFYMFSERHGR